MRSVTSVALFISFALFFMPVVPAVAADDVASQSHAGCAYQVIRPLGLEDGFSAPFDVRHPSNDLFAYLVNRNPKDYDDMTIDRHFGDSFKLDACTICSQICSAKLEIELQGTGGLDCNDSIFVGRAGGTTVAFGPIHLSGCVTVGPDIPIPDDDFIAWKQAQASTFNRTINLSVKDLQDLVCLEGYEYLDVIVQDDHGVDSMRLVIEY